MSFIPAINWIIGVLVLVCGSNFQIAYSIMNPNIAQDLDISLSHIALAASIHMWCFSIFQLFTGLILDCYGIKRVLPISILFIFIGTFLFSYSNYRICFFISQIFLSFGASFGFVGAGYISYKFFSYLKSGIMFGFVQAAYSISSLLMEYTYIFLISRGVSWRDLIRYIEYLEIAVFILTLLLTDCKWSASLKRNSISIRKLLSEVFYNIIELISLRDIWFSTIVGSLMFGIFLSVAILWGQKLLIALKLSTYYSGLVHSVIWIGFAIGSPIVNFVSRIVKNRKYVFMSFCVLQCISLMLLLCSSSLYILCILMFTFGFASGGHMLNFSIGTDIVDETKVGTVCSIINGFMSISGGIIIFIIGLVLEYQNKYNIIEISFFMPIITFLSLVFLFFCRETFHIK
ncbi:major facilitator family transporter [Ehrlichia ruminantium]|uniref:Major facilitator family transporter n=1 Tax=Ehrlichia ruminantium TaxID=779 RepID=A0A170U2J3_EHRRU|nr:MFS transporter [Ehrlichia ruminantium]GAT77097.1 major facilitator family transporter [Ehrlichia ruminantium]GAT78156.1 major facilitator family transporter [Ehrlichia ruminantium]GAT79298.1 major facilitator family transporter [Ehrlichia ruminantium]